MNMPSEQIDTLPPAGLSEALKTRTALPIDVREPAQYAAGRIAGALLYPLPSFDATVLPAHGAQRVVFHCGSDKRSLAAAQRRLAAGHSRAAHLGAGICAWKEAGLPIIRPGTQD